MGVRIWLSGEMLVTSDTGTVRATDFPGRQGRLAFARLAATPYPVPRGELAELLWPDRLPKSWERDLSTVISKVRTLLIGIGCDDPIASGMGCYQLTVGSDVHVDLNEAKQQLEDAETALARSEVLEAHAAGDVAVNHLARPFLPGEDGDWIASRRSERHELLLRALDVLVEVHIRRGILPEARRYALRLVDLEPYREPSHAALIRALVASGDRVGALKAYERARSTFVEEMGVQPGPVLDEAYQLALAADTGASGASCGATLPTGTVTLLFTDVVGSVALDERLDTAASEAFRRRHFGLLREAISSHGGIEVKNLGDGMMAVFDKAGSAVDAAIAVQRAVTGDVGETPVSVRIGIHVGEPTLDGSDYFGRPVAVARRLCDAADPDGILVSDLVRQLSTSPVPYVNERTLTLKGMNQPTRTWNVDWRSARP